MGIVGGYWKGVFVLVRELCGKKDLGVMVFVWFSGLGGLFRRLDAHPSEFLSGRNTRNQYLPSQPTTFPHDRLTNQTIATFLPLSHDTPARAATTRHPALGGGERGAILKPQTARLPLCFCRKQGDQAQRGVTSVIKWSSDGGGGGSLLSVCVVSVSLACGMILCSADFPF